MIQKHPDQIAARYARALRMIIVDHWMSLIEEFLLKPLSIIMTELRFDSRLDVAESQLRKKMKADMSTRIIIKRYAEEVSRFNRKEIEKVTSMDLARDIPNRMDVITTFVDYNVRLIDGLSEEIINKLTNRIVSGVRKEYTLEQIKKSIRYGLGVDKGIYKTIKQRMDLIATDQVGKLNGMLTKLRQKFLGITKYKWRTRNDKRVRPDHRKREGKIFRWSNPPSDGHPGEAINCRCCAEPFLGKA